MGAEAAPPLVLSIAYWLHMLATVVWLGGLAALALLVLPAARRTLDSQNYTALLAQLQKRLQQVGWFSLAILSVTGMFQMSSSPSYQGFLAINNPWATAMLFKHGVIGVMIAAAAYMTWSVLPALQRLAILQAAGRPVSEEQGRRLHRHEQWVLNLNLALSVIVLLLTAIARVFAGG
jgi:uncharacterized membrane protein